MNKIYFCFFPVLVLTATVVESARPEMAALTNYEQVSYGIQRFLGIFLGSAGTFLFFIRQRGQSINVHRKMIHI